MNLFKRRGARSFADAVARALSFAPSEGDRGALLLKRLLTFSDDMKVEIYARDLRATIHDLRSKVDGERAGRLAVEAQLDSACVALGDLRKVIRIDFDWVTGRVTLTDDGMRLLGGTRTIWGLVEVVGQVLRGARNVAQVPTVAPHPWQVEPHPPFARPTDPAPDAWPV